jgi:hypothetical protein
MTSYALHGLTTVLGPAVRVTAMSGVVLPRREFAGQQIDADIDDNSIALVDFGSGVFAVVHGTAAGTIIDDFAAARYFGTDGEIAGLVLNGEPFDFPGRELTTDAPTWDWDAQMRVLPHVTGPHRQIPESHVFEDIMQLVDWVREGVIPRLCRACPPRHRHHREHLPVCGQRAHRIAQHDIRLVNRATAGPAQRPPRRDREGGGPADRSIGAKP